VKAAASRADIGKTNPLNAAASRLLQASVSGKPCLPIRDLIESNDIEAAYAIQEINTTLSLSVGRRLVGRKIGLTSVAVQKQLGVNSPDSGMLFADMAICDGEPVPFGRVLQSKVEAEIAFVLEREIDLEQPTMADIIRSIGYTVAAIEIVGSRVQNWDISLVDTVADNASSGMFVLGNTPYQLNGLDLRDCKMQMTDKSGKLVSSGVGHACLGHPLNAALWLARKMSEVGRPLQAGDIILSGALGPMVATKPGEIYEARIEGLGSVRAAFADGPG
jgi:2-keto-4-pentenoate hydratase